MRRCESCHTVASHGSWLPYVDRHMTVLMAWPGGATNTPTQTITNRFKHSATRKLVRIDPAT